MAGMAPKDLSKEKLADGNILLFLKERFQDDMSEDNLVELMQTLRDSTLILPMQVIMSASDQELMKMNDVGQKFTPEDDIQVLPAVETIAGEKYMFIFSQPEQIPVDYSDAVTLMRAPFLKAYDYYKADGTLSAMVLDPFTENLELPEELLDAISTMESRFPE